MLKDYVKTHFQGIYDFARVVKKTSENRKKRKILASIYNGTHAKTVRADAPIKPILTNDDIKRLNLVFNELDKGSYRQKEITNFLKDAITFAKERGFALRIITRNDQANPRYFHQFLKENNLPDLESYSFYTDSSNRVSNPTRRLSVSKNDVFFTKREELIEWMEHENK